MKIAIVLLALSACFGTARADQVYEPPVMAGAELPDPYFADRERAEQAAARALAERRQRMIDECIEDHGSELDCKRETDTELRAEGLPWRNRVIQASPFR
jgi:hypothetical protein